MSSLLIKQIKIGDSKPKICVSIKGATKEAILKEAKEIESSKADIIEWRIDYYEEINSNSQVRDIIEALKSIVKKPIIFTARSTEEGGNFVYSEERYAQLLSVAIKSRQIDIIDVEIKKMTPFIRQICDFAKNNEVFTLGSYHNFKKTPTKDFLKKKLLLMKKEKFDMGKIAVMPQSKKDVLTLMEVALESSEDMPIIAISMDNLGKTSRVVGEFFNSAITFGALKDSSAPGQMPVEDLDEIINRLHAIYN